MRPVNFIIGFKRLKRADLVYTLPSPLWQWEMLSSGPDQIILLCLHEYWEHTRNLKSAGSYSTISLNFQAKAAKINWRRVIV